MTWEIPPHLSFFGRAGMGRKALGLWHGLMTVACFDDERTDLGIRRGHDDDVMNHEWWGWAGRCSSWLICFAVVIDACVLFGTGHTAPPLLLLGVALVSR